MSEDAHAIKSCPLHCIRLLSSKMGQVIKRLQSPYDLLCLR